VCNVYYTTILHSLTKNKMSTDEEDDNMQHYIHSPQEIERLRVRKQMEECEMRLIVDMFAENTISVYEPNPKSKRLKHQYIIQ